VIVAMSITEMLLKKMAPDGAFKPTVGGEVLVIDTPISEVVDAILIRATRAIAVAAQRQAPSFFSSDPGRAGRRDRVFAIPIAI